MCCDMLAVLMISTAWPRMVFQMNGSWKSFGALGLQIAKSKYRGSKVVILFIHVLMTTRDNKTWFLAAGCTSATRHFLEEVQLLKYK